MADDDNKIVIPVEVTTDEAKKALDDLVNTASGSFDKLAKKGDDATKASSDNNKSKDPFKDSFDFGSPPTKPPSPPNGPPPPPPPPPPPVDQNYRLDYNKSTDKYDIVTKEQQNRLRDEERDQRLLATKNNRDASGSTEDALRRALHAVAASPNARGVDARGASGSGTEVDEPESKLKRIGEAGKNAFKELNDSIDSVGSHSGVLASIFGESESAAEKFKETIHIAHPILEEAGVSLGNLGAFARLAGAGMGALGTAVVGTVLVGLAKVAEAAERTGARLKALTGSNVAGEELTERAKALGISRSELGPIAEQGLTYTRQLRADENQRGIIQHSPSFVAGPAEEAASQVQIYGPNQAAPGGHPTDQTIGSFQQALFEGAKIDRTPKDETLAGIKALQDSIFKSGKVTPDDLGNLAKVSVSLGEEVAKALSGFGPGKLGRNVQNIEEVQAFQKGGGQITTEQLVAAVARAAPGIHERAEAVPPGITEALEHLETAAKSVTEAFAGDAGVVSAVDKFAKLLDNAAKGVDKFLHPRDYEPGGAKFTGPVSPAEQKEHNTPDILDLGKTLLTGETDKRFDDSKAAKAAKFLRGIPIDPSAPPPKSFDELGVTGNLQKLSHGDFSNAYTSTPSAFVPHDEADKEVRDQAEQIRKEQNAPENGPRSEAEPQQNQQVASLGSEFTKFIDAVSAALAKANPSLNQGGQPVGNIGIRGEAPQQQPQPSQQDTAATQQVADLGSAAAEAAAKLREVQPAQGAAPAPESVAAADGGHIRGPGTSTSDSIPAMLSDGEYVLKADTVKKIGVENLDAVNNGAAHLSAGGEVHHFADGGKATKDPSGGLRGNLSVTYDETTGGAYINGALHVPGDPLLDTPDIKKALEESKASLKQQDQSKPKHKSQFIGNYGEFGAVEAASGGLIMALADGGLVGQVARGLNGGVRLPRMFQHFNVGGLAARASRATEPVIGFASGGVARDAPGMTKSEMEHWGTIDMRTDHGDVKVATERDTMRHLGSVAQRAKRFSTGSKPSWYGGAG